MTTETTSVEEQLSLLTDAQLAQVYGEISKQVKALEEEQKTKLAKRKERLEAIKRVMHKRMTEHGTDSITIAGCGNFHFRKSSTVSVADWTQFYTHLQQRLAEGARFDDIAGAFQKRVSQEYVAAFQEKHEGHVPPGVNLITTKEVFFRTA